MNLLLVESPSKCQIIEKYLKDKNVICMATCGHFRDIKSLQDIIISTEQEQQPIQIIYSMIHSKLTHINQIKNQLKNVQEIYIATDNDREGESIAWHICDYFHFNIETTKRILFNEITESSILYAFENPTFINMNIVNSSKARQVLDFLIGYNCSPLLWKQFQIFSLSAGRCQTPALQLICDHTNNHPNELQIFHRVIGYFTNKYIPFELNHLFPYDENSNHNDILTFFQNEITFEHTYDYQIQPSISILPPIPFNTCTLQQTANNKYQYSPKETMKFCQSLYEKGYITYMRTESTQLSTTFIASCHKYIEKKYGLHFIGSSPKNNNNNNNICAHEAIRVTNIELCNSLSLIPHLTSKEIKMYLLIYQNTLSSCMSNATMSILKAKINSSNCCYFFQYSCQIPIFLGWKIIYEKPIHLDENNYHYLQHCNTIQQCHEMTSEISIHNSKQHWTESHLIHELERLKIGRPSTFATIVEKIKERNYVEKQNINGTKNSFQNFKFESQKIVLFQTMENIGNEINKLVLQPLGNDVNQFLQTHFSDIFNYHYSKQMEDQLDLIATNQEMWWNICLPFYELLNEKMVFFSNKTKEIKKIKTIKNKKIKEKEKEKEKEKGDLGYYHDKKVIVKKGPYGLFVIYGDRNISLKDLGNRPIENITLHEIENVLDKKENKILRVIDDNKNILKGLNGKSDYIELINNKNNRKLKSKPQFISLKKFSENYLTCEIEIIQNWLRHQYGII